MVKWETIQWLLLQLGITLYAFFQDGGLQLTIQGDMSNFKSVIWDIDDSSEKANIVVLKRSVVQLGCNPNVWKEKVSCSFEKGEDRKHSRP